MKIKRIEIEIKSVKQGIKEFVKTVRSIQQGNPPKTKKEGVFFTSLEAMRRVLTSKRLELLHIIRGRHPHSIYELARITGRNLKNVQDDITMLSRIGLISLTKAKTPRHPLIPKVDYDNLQIQIPVI